MAILVIIVKTVGTIRIFSKLTDKMEQIENYKNTLGQLRTVMRFATPRQDPIYREEMQNLLNAKTAEEEEMMNDETLSEADDENPASSSRVEIVEADMEVPAMRNRVLRHDGAHEAADAGERDDGGNPAEEDEDSFELEETPMQRYQRYLQSGMEEVSDLDEWANIRHGFVPDRDSEPGGATTKSRPRDDYDDGSNPQSSTQISAWIFVTTSWSTSRNGSGDEDGWWSRCTHGKLFL